MAIADQSGYYPDETTAGILWVNLSQPILLTDGADGLECSCSVWKEGKSEEVRYPITLSLEEALWLLKEYDLPLHVRSYSSPSIYYERVFKLIERF